MDDCLKLIEDGVPIVIRESTDANFDQRDPQRPNIRPNIILPLRQSFRLKHANNGKITYRHVHLTPDILSFGYGIDQIPGDPEIT